MGDDVEVLIIDDHPVVGDGLVQLLRSKASPPGRLSRLAGARPRGDAVVRRRLALLDLDLGWPHETGLDLIEPLRAEGVATVVYSATRDRPLLALRAWRPAPWARSRRAQGIDDLIDAVMRARNGEAVNNLRERRELADELHQFRARQRERLAPSRP